MKTNCVLLAILFAASLFPALTALTQETEETYVLWGDPQR